MRSQIETGDTGSDPLPKALACAELTLGQQAADHLDHKTPTQPKERDVELHILHHEDFRTPLEVSNTRVSQDSRRGVSPPESDVSEPGDDAQISVGSPPSPLQHDLPVGPHATDQPVVLQATREDGLR